MESQLDGFKHSLRRDTLGRDESTRNASSGGRRALNARRGRAKFVEPYGRSAATAVRGDPVRDIVLLNCDGRPVVAQRATLVELHSRLRLQYFKQQAPHLGPDRQRVRPDKSGSAC